MDNCAGDCKEVIVWNLALGQQCISVETSSQFVSDLSWNLDSSVLAITFLKQYISLLHVHRKKYFLMELFFISNSAYKSFITCL